MCINNMEKIEVIYKDLLDIKNIIKQLKRDQLTGDYIKK